jgi:hypothetical protein
LPSGLHKNIQTRPSKAFEQHCLLVVQAFASRLIPIEKPFRFINLQVDCFMALHHWVVQDIITSLLSKSLLLLFTLSAFSFSHIMVQ